jgi:hypothetical protein
MELHQDVVAAMMVAFIALAAGATGCMERSQPAESHDRGIENSDQPQSTHTRTSGEGVIGGWLSIRGKLR